VDGTLVRVAGELSLIAHEEAGRALDKQERVVEELRSRTGVLLAVSSLAVSFLGRSELEQSNDAVVIAALAAFAVSIGACIYVLLPKSTLFFALSGPAVFEELFEFRENPAEIHRRLAYDMHRFWEANDRVLQRLFVAFRIAAVALIIEIAVLLAAVTDTLV
jgi:hypothetical protein